MVPMGPQHTWEAPNLSGKEMGVARTIKMSRSWLKAEQQYINNLKSEAVVWKKVPCIESWEHFVFLAQEMN